MIPFETIKPGDRVTIKTPHGSEISGRAVMFNTKFQCWVLNLGGPHGTPGLADARNTVKVKPGKPGSKFTLIAKIMNGGAHI
jgi:hypothetical protein